MQNWGLYCRLDDQAKNAEGVGIDRHSGNF